MSKIILKILDWIRKTFFEKDILPPQPQPTPTPQPVPTLAPVKETITQIITRVCIENGIEPELGIAVASCEGGLLNAHAINKNKDKYSSLDRGIFQFNSYWFQNITDAQAFDPEISTKLFCALVKNNGGLKTIWRWSMPCWRKKLSATILQKYNIT